MTNLSLPEREPTVVRSVAVGVVVAFLHLLVGYDVIEADKEPLILGFVDALGLLILVLSVRGSVVPAAKVVTRVTTQGDVVFGEAAVEPTNSLADDGTQIDDGETVAVATVRPELLA